MTGMAKQASALQQCTELRESLVCVVVMKPVSGTVVP